MLKAFVGLGNPGKEYEKTRHNMGFLVIQSLAQELAGVSFHKDKSFECWRTKSSPDLVLPATFMNESGRAVGKLARFYNWQPEEILVVVDDMHLEFGQMRLKLFGGTGGHNGLKSIDRDLGSNHYPRLRIGIGQPIGSWVDHVLGRFTQEEESGLAEIISKAVSLLKRLLTEDFACVAGETNQKVQKEKEKPNETTKHAV